MDDGNGHFETLVVDDEPTEGVVARAQALCALAPVGLLAELTHRCPLQCSYCSNPLELERVNKELTTEEWVLGDEAGRRDGHPAGASLRRRADGAQGSRGHRLGCVQGRALHQSDHRRRHAQPPAPRRAGQASASITCRSPSRTSMRRTPSASAPIPGATQKKLDVARWVTELGLPLTINAPIHRQNIHNVASLHRACAQARRPAARSRPCPILRLGLSQPRRADPDLRADHRVDRARRARARAAEGRAHHRHGGAGLLRQAPEALHGRLGQRLHEHHPVRQGAPLPRRRDHQASSASTT